MPAPFVNIDQALQETFDEWDGTSFELLHYLDNLIDKIDKLIEIVEERINQEY